MRGRLLTTFKLNVIFQDPVEIYTAVAFRTVVQVVIDVGFPLFVELSVDILEDLDQGFEATAMPCVVRIVTLCHRIYLCYFGSLVVLRPPV